MRILFFIVHPSKYHLFKITINRLISEGHTIDIVIIKKDVLEELVKTEGWNYVNLFPEGRQSKSTKRLDVLISIGINFFKTLWRLYKLLRKKKYDLYITDDCLTIIGKLKKIPTLFFIDNDFKTVREYKILLQTATEIIAPAAVDLEEFNAKTKGFKGHKALAHLAPRYFIPDYTIVQKILSSRKELQTTNYELSGSRDKYYILRVSFLNASHDNNNKGIDNIALENLIRKLEKHGYVFISAERKLPEQFEHLRIKINPLDIRHLLYYAEMFIGDSATMAAEAAVLGCPNVLINKLAKSLGVLIELKKNGLQYFFDDINEAMPKIEYLISNTNLKHEWSLKRENYLSKVDDFNEFLYKIIKMYEKTS